MTFADIKTGEFVERMDNCYEAGLIDPYPVLKSHFLRLNATPGIAQRVAARPKYPF